jgi:hypothetical protein
MALQHPRWTDQPEFEEFDCLLDMLLDGPTMVQVAEVTHKGKTGIAVSAGNLFGSQTIMVPDHRQAFKALEFLQETCGRLERCKTEEAAKKCALSVSEHGWELLPNKEKANAK